MYILLEISIKFIKERFTKIPFFEFLIIARNSDSISSFFFKTILINIHLIFYTTIQIICDCFVLKFVKSKFLFVNFNQHESVKISKTQLNIYYPDKDDAPP